MATTLPRVGSSSSSKRSSTKSQHVVIREIPRGDDEDEDEEPAGFYYSSEDDERWGEPHALINAFACGWCEDGRLGFVHPNGNKMQLCPRPIAGLLGNVAPNDSQRFICKKASAGGRHSLLLMIDSVVKLPEPIRVKKDNYDSDDDESKHKRPPKPKRKRKVLITGLNQCGLCEEPGTNEPVEVPWEESYDRPVDVAAGKGTSFIVTKKGHLYSFGNGRFGVLGHGNTESYSLPRRIAGLERKYVLKVAVGAHHAIALADDHVFYSWGKNNKGQLGIGRESVEEVVPNAVVFPPQASKADMIDVACGFEHTIALLRLKTRVSNDETMVYGWGDESRGQLGSGDKEFRFRPQENRYVTKFCRTNILKLKAIAAGGYHNMLLVDQSGQVISWGAGDYGQLGHGFQFDTNEPQIVNGIDRAISISAGMRHSMAVCERQTIDVMVWGYNAYGELGLSDTSIRLHPTKISAIKNSRVIQVSCGDRHSIIVTSHHPVKAHELPALKPYFQILETEGNNRLLMRKLKWTLGKEGMDPNLLDDPMAILPQQPGSNGEEVKNDKYERGLRYCLDTKSDPFDWRRKAMETCFKCYLKGGVLLEKVCLSCARLCVPNNKLVPYTRHRQSTDTCDCRTSGKCLSLWTKVRNAFDQFCDIEDQCIGPNQVRQLLKGLRAPFPVENADVEDCITILADGVEDTSTPRLKPVPFERWYRKFYDENIDGDYFPCDDSAN